MSPRSYRSIGDVLTLLRPEFPDITISKIRFLESQGLVTPQRSPSGYRKFYDEDIERVRYILVQQREHFLPLKVIRDRLNGEESVDGGETSQRDGGVMTEEYEENEVSFVERITESGSSISLEAFSERVSATAASHAQATSGDRRTSTVVEDASIDDMVAAMQEGPAPRTRAPMKTQPTRNDEAVVVEEVEPLVDGETVSVEELAERISVDEAFLDSLVDFGIVRSVSIGGLTCFDEPNAELARLAAAFAAFGIEPRHLKAYRNAAEREVGTIEQIVSPSLRQRNPEARAAAKETAKELAKLGREMRATVVAQQLRDLFSH